MTDIAERLREQAWRRSGAPKMDAGHTKMLEWQAADVIERLRAALDGLLDWVNEGCPEGGYYAITEAKAVLHSSPGKSRPLTDMGIIWWLRGAANNSHSFSVNEHHAGRLREAADEIERLRERIADLQAQLGYAESIDAALHSEAADKIERLHAEVLRLRAALQTIAGTSKFEPPPPGEAAEIARVALDNECVVEAVQRKVTE